jgi:hypothetical protein
MRIKQRVETEGVDRRKELFFQGENLTSIWKAQSCPTYNDSVRACKELSNWFRKLAGVQKGSKGLREEFLALASLVYPSTRKGEAIKSFAKVRKHLANAIACYKKSRDTASLGKVHVYKAFSYWFQPTYKGFSPIENALQIYNSANLALNNNVESVAGAFLQTQRTFGKTVTCLALFCKLRILGFLIRSGKVPEAEMEAGRKAVEDFIHDLEVFEPKKLLAGLLYIALAFTYLRWDANYEKALDLYSKALQNIGRNPSFRGFAALAAWEAALCVEGVSERMEDAESYKAKILEALGYYNQAAEYAESTTWHFYRGLIHYNTSAIISDLASKEEEMGKARENLQLAISEGKKSLEHLSMWSPQESDFLGGSWLASAYQHLASAAKDSDEKRRAIIAALGLTTRALRVVSDPNIKLRFSEDNIGDVHYNTSRYYLLLSGRESGESKAQVQNTRRAIQHAEMSLRYYGDKSALDRAIKARMLAGRLYLSLVALGEVGRASGNMASSVKKSVLHYREGSTLCSELRWWATQAECHEKIANVHELTGRYDKSAQSYVDSVKSYEKLAQEKPKFAKTVESSKTKVKAWHSVQIAKLDHFKGNYSESSKSYEEAAKILKGYTLEHLRSDFFYAMSLLEQAEQVNVESSVDRIQEKNTRPSSISMKLLKEAKVCFDRISKDIAKQKEEPNVDDYQGTQNLRKLARFNSGLCSAKILLEQARSFSSLGSGQKASSLLDKASELFRWLGDWRNEAKVRNEMKSLSLFCKGLSYFEAAGSSDVGVEEKNKRKKDSQHLYSKASEVFRGASNVSPSKVTKSLALGLAFLSGAFGAQVEFRQEEARERGRIDVGALLKTRERLSKASSCFREAKQTKFHLLATASKDLLDATINVRAAENELDAVERVNYYRVATKSLRRAAESYHSAGSTSKYNYTLSMINAVENEESVVFSLTDTLTDFKDQSLFYSTVISSLSPEVESTQSLAENYEGAKVEISVEVPNDTVLVLGDKVTVDISMLNLGRETAILQWIDGAVPEGLSFSSMMVEGLNESGSSGHSGNLVGQGRTSNFKIFAGRLELHNVRLDPNQALTYKLILEAAQAGNHAWLPSLVYSDQDRSQRVARTARINLRVEEKEIEIKEMEKVVEEKKKKLEKIGESEGKESESYKRILLEVREAEVKVEETINRIRFEFENLKKDLNKVEQEISEAEEEKKSQAVDSAQFDELRARLFYERRKLSERLDRLKSKYGTLTSLA